MRGRVLRAGPPRRSLRARALALLTAGALVGHVLVLQGLRQQPGTDVGLPSARAGAAMTGPRVVPIVIGPAPAGTAPGVARRQAGPVAGAGGVPGSAARPARAPVPQAASALPPHGPKLAAATGEPEAAAVPPALADATAAAGVARAQAGVDGTPLPEYPAALPPDFHTRLAVLHGGSPGEGRLQFSRDPEGRYRLQLSLLAAERPLLAMTSSGHVGAAGLDPERHTDRRHGRGASAANFDPLAGTVRFSTGAAEAAVGRAAQDRLSWLVQLSAIVGADARLQQPGAQVLLQVVGARGGAQLWRFLAVPPGEPPGAGPPVDGLLRFVREPEQPYDLRVEAWLDPAEHHRPARLRLTPVPSGPGLEFWVVEG